MKELSNYKFLDPFDTPSPIYPEWYFLYVFGFLFLVPFIDRNPSTDIRKRKVAVALGVIAVLGVLCFIYYSIVHH